MIHFTIEVDGKPTRRIDRNGISYLTEIGKREMMEGKVQRAEWFSSQPPKEQIHGG